MHLTTCNVSQIAGRCMSIDATCSLPCCVMLETMYVCHVARVADVDACRFLCIEFHRVIEGGLIAEHTAFMMSRIV